MDVLRVIEAEGHGHGQYHGRSPTDQVDEGLLRARHLGRQRFGEAGFVALAVALAILVPVLGYEHVVPILMGGLGLLAAAVPVGGWVGESALSEHPHAGVVGALGAVTCLALGIMAGGAWSVLSDPAHIGLELRVYERLVLPLFWGVALGGWLAAVAGGLIGRTMEQQLRS